VLKTSLYDKVGLCKMNYLINYQVWDMSASIM